MSESRSSMQGDEHDLIVVVRCETFFEAETKAIILREAGIDAFVFSSEASWLGTSTPQFSSEGVPVFVTRNDCDRATETLAHAADVSESIDWDEADFPSDHPQDDVHVSSFPVSRVWIGVLIAMLFILWLMMSLTR